MSAGQNNLAIGKASSGKIMEPGSSRSGKRRRLDVIATCAGSMKEEVEDYARYGVVKGKRALEASLSCGIQEEAWSVWVGAARGANLKIKYVSLKSNLYSDYLNFNDIVVEEKILWSAKEAVDILLCYNFPEKTAPVWVSQQLQLVVAYKGLQRQSEIPEGWKLKGKKVAHWSVGGLHR